MELDKTLEARRKAQRNGEEDPVIVAQRFLNIFRQLHIFNAEKKAGFNQMLLELSPQIRGMFGQLPGGSLLQEYVDDLAEKEGVVKAVSSHALDIADDDVKQAKILATALAEAQVQASVKMQEMGTLPAAPLVAASVGAAPISTAKLSMDKAFAQEFATVLSEAMQKNSANQEVEIKNIINTLGRTQLEIIKVLQTENTEHREEMKSISQMMLQAQSQAHPSSGSAEPQPAPKISDDTKQLIRILLDGQKQMIERLAKVETLAEQKAPVAVATAVPAIEISTAALGRELAGALERSEQNFGKMITALSERQKSDTLEIARMINESQQSLVQTLVQHNTLNQNSGNAAAANNNANNIQIHSTDYSGVLSQIAEKLANLQPAQTSAPLSVSAAPTSVQIAFPEQAFGDIIKAQSELYRELAAEQSKELSAIITLALTESQKASTQNIIDALGSRPVIIQQPEYAPATIVAEPPHPIPQTVYSEDGDTLRPEVILDNTPQADPIDLFGDEEKETPQPEPNFVFNEGPAEEKEAAVEEEAIAAEEEAPRKKKKRKKKKNRNPEDFLPQAEETIAETALAEEEPAEIIETAPEVTDENIWLEDTAEPEPAVEQSFDFPEIVAAESLDNPDDWGFAPAAEPESQDWEWAYEEEPLAEAAADDGEGTDWEWDYVEEDSAETFHSANLQPLGAMSPICSGNLFFQEQVYSPQPLANSPLAPYLEYLPGIIDSAAAEKGKDPYQNSARKD